MLWKYTVQYLKKHKARTLLSLVFMTSLLSMMLGINVFASYKDELAKNTRLLESGIWQVSISNIMESDIYKNDPYVLIKYGKRSELIDDVLISVEGDIETIMAYHVVKGRLPEASNEIAISQYGLAYVKDKPTLNEEIETPFGTYILVGITDYAKNEHNTFYPDFIGGKQENYDFVELVLAGQKNMSLIHQIQQQSPNSFMLYYEGDSISEIRDIFHNNLYYMSEVIMIGSLGYILMLNFTYLGIKKREQDYVLLRGIGALKRQLFTMSIIETSVLFLISLPLGIGIAVIMAKVITQFESIVQMNELVSFDLFASHIALTYMIVLISNCRPVIRSINHALSGAFDAKEETLTERPHRKLKRITLFTLAKTQLRSQLRNAIFLMVVLIGIFTSIMTVVNTTLKNEKLIRQLDQEIANVTIPEWDLEGISKEELISEGLDYQEVPYRYANSNSEATETLFNADTMLMDMTSIDLVRGTFEIEGRMPKNDNEVLVIGFMLEDLYHKSGHIMIDGKEYLPVGIIQSLEFTHEGNVGNIIYSPTYHDIIFGDFDILSQPHEQMPIVRYAGKETKNPAIAQAIINAKQPFIDERQGLIERAETKTSYFITAAVFLTFMYLLSHIQKIEAIQEKITSYKQLGLTRLEIFKIYFYETIIINGFALSIGLFFSNALGSFISMIAIVLFSFVLLVIFSTIYLLPVIFSIHSKDHQVLSYKE